jgi:hypothetical protein
VTAESNQAEVITIVEGPTPEFHVVSDPWTFSVLEGRSGYIAAACQVRSYNGQKLLERCERAWRSRRPIRLDFKEIDGLRRQVEIIGARLEKIDNVDVLNLWVRQRVRSLLDAGADAAQDRSEE